MFYKTNTTRPPTYFNKSIIIYTDYKQFVHKQQITF